MVVLVEVGRKAYLASIVPVIVNAILNEHQLIIDIVAFVSKGDFPRSRLGEKQRGKILASWVTRKMRTIAQFSIRDADGADSQITEVAEPRSGMGSVVGVGSSLKNVETVTTPQIQRGHDYISAGPASATDDTAPYESSIVESPPLPLPKDDDDRDDTPTGAPENTYVQPASDGRYRSNSNNVPQIVTSSDYFPPQDPAELHSESVYSPQDQYNTGNGYKFSPLDGPDAGPDFDFNPSSAPPPPRFDSNPTLQSGSGKGGESYSRGGDLYSLPSQSRNVNGSSSRGGQLRVANANHDEEEEGRWPEEAILHMNLSKGDSRKGSRYDGSGYGSAM